MGENMLRAHTLALLIGLFVVGGHVASAQTTGAISGTVKDSSGGVLPTAEVVVTHTDTGIKRTTLADGQGRYRVLNLAIGTYEVAASLTGFQTAVQTGISLTIGREAVVELTLGVGDLTDQVTVTADAPLVDTRSGSLGGVVDRETILEIPLSGRDLTGLITLQAGTTMSSTTSDGASQGYSNKFSIGGSRVGDNAVLLDGTDVRSMDQGVPAGVSGNFLGGEAIQEFKVERNSYSAEYGGSAGGVINVVSKSGTNDFHGSVYGFTRNSAVDATNFRAPEVFDANGSYAGREKPDFWRAQYGVSAGGRLIQNRTFYFANFEGMRERLGLTQFVTTLSANGRQGVVGNRQVEVNPAVVPYFDLWPLPGDATDLGDGTARYASTQSQPTDEDFYQVRIDHNLSDSDAIFGRVTRQVSERTTPEPISRWQGNSKVYNTFSTFEHRRIFTSRLLNTSRFGFNRRGIADFSTESPAADSSLFMVPPDKWLAPLGADPIMGSLLVSGLSQVGLGRGWVDRNTNRFQFVNGTVYTRGAMTWKLGVDFTHMRMGGDNPSRPGGELTFGSVEAFLRGRPRQFRGDVLPETDWNRNLTWNTFGWYVQNDWEIASRLTLNLGLRHEFYTVPTERDGKIANLRNPYTDTEITILGTNGDDWWENPSLLNFSPRVGLAWSPSASGKWAVRAGAGIFQNLIQPETFRQFAWRTAPFALETIFAAPEGVIPFPTGLYDYIVGLGSEQGSIFVFPYDDFGNPRMEQWNVNVQRELMPNTSVTVGYAGSRGVDLLNQVFLNAARADLIDGRYVFPADAARPNPAFNQDLASPQSLGKSWYHSFQVELSRRFNAGWQMQLAYTRSKSTDLGSQFTPTFDGNSGGPSVYLYDPELGRGLSAFHVGQRLSASAVWQLPGAERGGVAGAILGGWQLSGILNLADGAPLTVSIATPAALAAIGIGAQGSAFRPDLVSGGDENPVIGNPDQYFDASQFGFPAARTLGSLGRNTLIGPGIANVDLGLTRNISLGNTSRIQVRVEVFNLLNRANLGSPSSQVFNAAGVPSGNAGFISTTSTTARQIQLGLRLDW